MNKQEARIIALDIAISLIRAETGNPTGLTGIMIDEEYDRDFGYSDNLAIWDAMDEIADQLAAKHTRSIDCLSEPKRLAIVPGAK